jgi:hypothetical protein
MTSFSIVDDDHISNDVSITGTSTHRVRVLRRRKRRGLEGFHWGESGRGRRGSEHRRAKNLVNTSLELATLA